MVLLVCGMGHFAAFAQDDSFGMPPLVDDTSADFPDESVNLVMIETFRSPRLVREMLVVPLAGTWIETIQLPGTKGVSLVVPLAGTWIETT